MSDYMIAAVWNALIDTLIMVSVSGIITWFAGIALGVILFTTAKNAVFEAPNLNKILGVFINGFRAMPFIILLVALVPFTRWLVGTTIGVSAAIVPITLGSIPFFARIVEISLREVNGGTIEAAQALGCERRHLIFRVLLPEALPSIVGGFTVTVVAMIGASAMAGAIGAGGLGDLAIRYGYQRYDTMVMSGVIVILFGIVSVIQYVGNNIVARLRAR